jgi:ABC-type multidrug transport system fused ATPase/permease subunit
VDGNDLKGINVRHWRSKVALVSQEPLLFAGYVVYHMLYIVTPIFSKIICQMLS